MLGIVGNVYSLCARQRFVEKFVSRAVAKHRSQTLRHASSFAAGATSPVKCSRLSSRALLRVSGKDSENLLQGLITNDMGLMRNERAIYTMLLNLQGRVLYDAIIYREEPSEVSAAPAYYLECDANVVDELQKHLKTYKLRKKVVVTNVSSEYEAWAVYNNGGAIDFTSSPPISVADPRVPSVGHRLLVQKNMSLPDMDSNLCEVPLTEYDTHRYLHGIPEGIKDLPPGNSLPLESNLDYMNGVSFHKGCYLGQELTARTYHTGVIRKRLMPIKFICDEGDRIIKAGETVKTPEGKNAGKFRNHIGVYGLALVRMAFSDNLLRVSSENGHTYEVKASVPGWWPHKSSDDVSKLHSN
ncbi:putative transferase CAF17 homolog, mitochondrial [Ptychodera flava]|uniref:putative transferase CAF17 homolog, mitochondrial n=1 Tax=Ptychodera flava TaxID=63121 RepID=UPI00396A82D5